MKSTFIWQTVSMASEFVIGFMIMISVSRWFSVDDFGVWMIFMTVLFIATKMREGMVQNAIVKFSNAGDGNQKMATYKLSLGLILAIEGITFVVSFGSAFLFVSGSALSLFGVFIAMSLPQALFRFSQLVLQSELRTKQMALANMGLIGLMSITLAVVWLVRPELNQLPLFLGVPYLVAFLAQSVVTLPSRAIVSADLRHIPWSAFVNYARQGFLRELVGTLSSRAYIFAGAWVGGVASSAFLGVASRYANLVYLPNSAFQSVLYPKACAQFTPKDSSDARNFFVHSLSTQFLVVLPYTALFLLAAWTLIPLIHGAEYVQSVPFLVALALHGAFIAPVGHAFGSLMHVLERPGKVTALVSSMSVLSLVSTLIASIYWGVWGSVLAPMFTDLIGLWMMNRSLRAQGIASLLGGYTLIPERIRLLFSTNLQQIRL